MSSSDPLITTLVVPGGMTMRLDRFLAQRLHGGSRQRARELIAARAVRVNGRRAGKASPLRPGDVVTVARRTADASHSAALTPEPGLAVRILYEDAAIVALDKPAGMPSTAARTGDRGTVANFLAGRYPETVRLGGRAVEAGLAHRLDTGTSGVLLAARTVDALQALRRQFRRHEIEKTYLALVAGDIDAEGMISHPIAHAPRHPRRMTVCRTAERARRLKAREAVTFYRPIERFGTATLLEIRMRTGVRHQIRVHLASIGNPLLGDSLYNRDLGPMSRAPRLLLHASQIRFRHPLTGTPVAVSAARPRDLGVVLRELRAAQQR